MRYFKPIRFDSTIPLNERATSFFRTQLGKVVRRAEYLKLPFAQQTKRHGDYLATYTYNKIGVPSIYVEYRPSVTEIIVSGEFIFYPKISQNSIRTELESPNFANYVETDRTGWNRCWSGYDNTISFPGYLFSHYSATGIIILMLSGPTSIYHDNVKIEVGGYVYGACYKSGTYLAFIHDHVNGKFLGRFFNKSMADIVDVELFSASVNPDPKDPDNGTYSLPVQDYVKINKLATKASIITSTLTEYDISFSDKTITINRTISGVVDFGYDDDLVYVEQVGSNVYADFLPEYTGTFDSILNVYPEYKAVYYYNNTSSGDNRDFWNCTRHIVVGNFHAQADYSNGVRISPVTWDTDYSGVGEYPESYYGAASGLSYTYGKFPFFNIFHIENYEYMIIVEDKSGNLLVNAPPFNFILSNGTIRDDSDVEANYQNYNYSVSGSWAPRVPFNINTVGVI